MDAEIVTFIVKGSAQDKGAEVLLSVCLRSQAQRDTSDPDNSQNLGYCLTIRH